MIYTTNNRPRQIRVIVKSNTISPVYGVVLPPQLMEKWEGVYVRVYESGNKIILESGAQPMPFSKKQINSFSKKIDVVEI